MTELYGAKSHNGRAFNLPRMHLNPNPRKNKSLKMPRQAKFHMALSKPKDSLLSGLKLTFPFSSEVIQCTISTLELRACLILFYTIVIKKKISD
jgi:hypothetical protein